MAGKAAYKNKWQTENCDRINLIVPKGKKDVLKQIADTQGESLNSFVNTAIDERIARLEGKTK